MANFKVTDGALNVRIGPSLLEQTVNIIREGDIIKQLEGSEIVTEVNQPAPLEKRTWMKIEDGEFDGWVSLKNLSLQANGSFEVTNDSGANVRSEPLILSPDTTSIVGNLPKGTVVPTGTMVAEIDNPEARRWIRIDLLSGKSGWSSMLLLKPATDSTTQSQIQYKVTADALHVRSGPSLQSNSIGKLANGVTLPEGEITIEGDRSWMKVATPTGFVSMKFLSKVGAIPVSSGVPNWYQIAKGEEGIKEFGRDSTGEDRDNPEVVKYLKSCSKLSASLQRNDETAWCSAFINWCVEKAGFEGTESGSARSWMHWGQSIASPVVGCIVVLRRTSNPAFGHVGFWVKEDANRVYLLGGNQSDSVNVTAFDKSRVLKNGYRMNL